MPNFISSLYFAYGSNLSIAQMKHRCPDAEPVCPFSITDWRLEFVGRGVATIVPHVGARVEGALWRITAKCEAALDRIEGYKPHEPHNGAYRKVDFKIVATGEGAFMYLSNRRQRRSPTAEYVNTLRHGFRDWGIKQRTLNRALDRCNWHAPGIADMRERTVAETYKTSEDWEYEERLYTEHKPVARKPKAAKTAPTLDELLTKPAKPRKAANPVSEFKNGVGTDNRFPP